MPNLGGRATRHSEQMPHDSDTEERRRNFASLGELLLYTLTCRRRMYRSDMYPSKNQSFNPRPPDTRDIILERGTVAQKKINEHAARRRGGAEGGSDGVAVMIGHPSYSAVAVTVRAVYGYTHSGVRWEGGCGWVSEWGK